MSKKRFTEEQLAVLRQNPYVYSATPATLALTREFKELFYTEYQKGASPRQILEDHGFDINIIGERRVWSISQHIRSEYAKYGEFHEGFRGRSPGSKAPTLDDQPPSEQDQLKQLQHEVEYLKQEMEFLKKISTIRNTRK